MPLCVAPPQCAQDDVLQHARATAPCHASLRYHYATNTSHHYHPYASPLTHVRSESVWCPPLKKRHFTFNQHVRTMHPTRGYGQPPQHGQAVATTPRGTTCSAISFPSQATRTRVLGNEPAER
jgi:hypothetical protein